MTAPELPHAPEADAVGAPVEQPVRPAVYRLNTMEGTNAPPLWHYVNAPWPKFTSTPLYDQAALDAAVAAQRERCARLCVERAQLSWAAADQPYAPEVKMQHEAVAAAMEELAGER